VYNQISLTLPQVFRLIITLPYFSQWRSKETSFICCSTGAYPRVAHTGWANCWAGSSATG